MKDRWPKSTGDAICAPFVQDARLKEVSKRAFTLRDLFKVKSQPQLLKAVRKKTVIGEGGEFRQTAPDDADHEPHNLATYLSKLYTLLLAYAIVGARPFTWCVGGLAGVIALAMLHMRAGGVWGRPGGPGRCLDIPWARRGKSN